MKKALLMTVIFTLFLSGCQLIPILLPTASTSSSELTEAPESEATSTPIDTPTLTARPTSEPTSTPLSVPSTTPTPLPLILQTGSPAYIQNFAHADAGCNWLGIAGQVFDANSKTINNLVVIVKGRLGQLEIDKLALTGIPEGNIYGPGGYEIKIADRAALSENTLMIQVLDIKGNRMAEPMPFNTYSDCDKNLIIINFQMN